MAVNELYFRVMYWFLGQKQFDLGLVKVLSYQFVVSNIKSLLNHWNIWINFHDKWKAVVGSLLLMCSYLSYFCLALLLILKHLEHLASPKIIAAWGL